MRAEAIPAQTTAQRRALAGIAVSQLLALTLWFSASAVAPQLQALWSLSEGQAAWLTLAVQLGFVVGALGLAVLNVPDLIPSRTLFVISAVVGLTANAALVLAAGSYPLAVGLRLVTGTALAGVYPSGLKVMAGWFREGRGMALGVLVGALTVGSAGPHLIRGLGLDWRGVVLAASALAAVGAALMARVGDGPFEVPPQRFSWRHAGRAVRNRGVRLATYGYLGHMWELYAMWTWTAAWLAASELAAGRTAARVSLATFVVIAVGGASSWLAGVWADRAGRTLVAGGSMALSGSCALLTPLVFAGHPSLVLGLFVVWGAAVIADSAQFSTMVTETADDEVRGTALALQTAVGFLLTLATIRLVPLLAAWWGWQWAFPVLALGPALGIAAMVRLRRSRFSSSLAGGRG